MESTRDKVNGGMLAVIGFLLSPLSWWNDAFVNLPLAIGFGWGVAFFYPPAFRASVIVGYWMTNVLGFVLMHKGAAKALGKNAQRYGWKSFGRDLAISSLYSALIVVLLKTNVLRPFENYFPQK